MTREELFARVRQFEDPFVERKSNPDRTEVVASVVAFANSVPPGREAVLFLGVRPNGTAIGLDNPDALQRKINDWLDETYPRVAARFEVLDGLAERPVLAVVVSASDERPHFAGPAWVREGSETMKAPPKVYDDLIASRNTKAGAILRRKGQAVAVLAPVVISEFGKPDEIEPGIRVYECQVEGCTAHSVDLYHPGSGRTISLALERLDLTADPKHQRPLRLIVKR